ncbi:sugar phosphate isomerase/epimerase family protein [Sphingobacterium tabacisoli]|uniref:Sugar phosphate isomerase/epimerase family protein n=1 Tax=Sphingobacterium tabacisoli TaxID=2044855 RepID=A0ABW5L4N0_9SPHI|nr:sugar phosphate isomerase/epimerase [Sphingobacterium tabacisoli]
MKSIKAVLVLATIMMTGCSLFKSDRIAETKQYPEEALGWKLGAQAYTFNRFTFTEALDKIDSSGLRYVEAYPQQIIGGGIDEKMDYNMSESSKQYIRQLLQKKNIILEAYGVIKTNNDDDWEKVFKFAKSMGVRTITCEPEARLLDYISTLCDRYDIRVALHNHPNPSYYWDPEVVLNSVKDRSIRMGAAADIGHWVRSGLDPVACLKKLEGRIYHLHFKDLNEKGNKKAHDVHWGTGVNNVPGVIAELKRQHFKGMISAEYEYNWDNNMPDVKKSVENFRGFVKGDELFLHFLEK